jgi:hypothetical protein
LIAKIIHGTVKAQMHELTNQAIYQRRPEAGIDMLDKSLLIGLAAVEL